ncbi:MAG: energy-coupling factor transporter transmembrane component T family protein [Lachnospiraceae bacterium]
MIRDITIGQYYPADSCIHRLDPRTKLIVTFLYIIGLFLVNRFIGFGIAAIFFLMVLFLSRIPVSYIFKGLKPILFIIFLTVAINFLFGTGEVLVSWWIFSITVDGIRRGIFFAIRLILLMFGTSMMTFTTTTNQLTDGIESVFKPLKYIKVPIHEIAMMMSIALRFIPILLEETDKIMKAQMARGADFESGNVLRRAKAMVPIFIPLIISAFRRAFDLAMAMEARCYHGGEGRTRMNPMKYGRGDYVAYTVALLFFVALVVTRFLP